MTARTFDVVIVGGAVMGSSIACHLALDPDFSGSVLVIEKDPSYRACASALSAASIRQQFSDPTNIAISLYGIEFLREIGTRLATGDTRPAIDLHEGGYCSWRRRTSGRSWRKTTPCRRAWAPISPSWSRMSLPHGFPG